MSENVYKGLSAKEVEESRAKYGVNILTPPEKESVWSQFLEKFSDPLIKILLVALCLSLGIACYEVFGLGDGLYVFFEPLGIFVAIILATVIGFALELNANKKFEMLNKVNDDVPVTVVRDGNVTQVARKDIVVGDIVMLGTGDEVPADGTLLETVSLSINESTLTGEPVIKKSHLPEEFKKDATYPTNKALRGTTVTEGHGVMRVDAVGDATEYGKVYVAAQIDNGVKTPLTLQFERLGSLISYASYTIGALIIVGRLLIFDYGDFDTLHFVNYALSTIMLAVTLVVVSVPEGLPMSVTLSLALSMRRMLETNNLVRKMHACETMGAATVICTDKTGTLTQNQMRIYKTSFAGLGGSQKMDGGNEAGMIAEAIAVNSTAFLDNSEGKPKVIGNPTEGALLLWLKDNGIDYLPLRESAEVVEQLPFSTMRKFMATVVKSNAVSGRRVLYVKGAPEIVMAMCKNFAEGVTEESLKAELLGYQQKAMRTLGFACQILEGDEPVIKDGKLAAGDLRFMGITAIADPVRDDVPAAIQESLDAGLQIKIVTGDTPGTATEIGRQIGLWDDAVDTDANRISGPDFAALPDDEAAKAAKRIKIMSRARPTDKSRLVSLLQKQGEVVAVTGDGTNDAPALNAAQVGLSMGDGTSVAKEASDITIMDNSFASITRAVMWGRSLYQNIQRFILFQLTVNLVACIIVLIGAFTGQESPLSVTQMLWVNLIMDTFAALSLASLPPNKEVMKDKPRHINDFIINRAMKWFIIGVSVVFVFVLFGFMQYLKYTDLPLSEFSISEFFASYFRFDISHASMTAYDLTVFFTFFVFLQFWNLFNAKSFESGHSCFVKIKDSKVFFMTVLLILAGQIVIVNFGGMMFNVTPLKLVDWVILFVASSFVMWIGEIVHLIYRIRYKSH